MNPGKYIVTYEKNAFSHNENKLIELLGEFLRFPDELEDVIELGFNYVRKKPEHLPEWIHKIREQLSFDREDFTKYNFDRQIILFKIIYNGIKNRDLLFINVFYELSKTFLAFSFRHIKSGRNHSFYMYNFDVPNVPPILNFRSEIWNTVSTNYKTYPHESFDLLLNYLSLNLEVSKELLEYDIAFLINIIENNFSPDIFEQCMYVHDLVRWSKRNLVFNPFF